MLDDVAAAPLDEAPFAAAELVVVAVPSRAFGEVVAGAARRRRRCSSLTKGLDPATGNRLSTLARRSARSPSSPARTSPRRSATGLPAAAVIASEDEALAERLQHEINSLIFRVYVNPDLVGVELCAAAKNVIALAAGGVDGLGLGDNAKAAIVTRGLAEMARLGEACGAPRRDVRGARGHGRPDRHVLVAARAQPPRRRADRAGRVAGRGRGARSARSKG